MKLSVAIIFTSISGAMSSSLGPVSAKSKMGLKLLKHARQLEDGGQGENDEGGNDGENDDAQNYYQNDITWVEDYSLKFIGCHQVAQWNANADGDEDAVRIETERFIRFRLCPTRYCSADRAVGCSSSYGDYVVDMDTFVASHLENQQDLLEEKCQAQLENCGCDERRLEDGDDNNCLYNCYYNAGMEQCQDDGESDLDFLANYGACNNYQDDGNGERRRKLDEEAAEYYIAPYCADQGGEVLLGMFTDNTCTTFADDNGGKSTYEAITGASLPYSSEPVIDGECYSCKQSADDYYEDEVLAICADTYEVSGKCETQLSYHLDSINENACNWIHGIAITPISSNGIIHAKYHGSLKAAIAIGIFATLFVACAFYVSFLRSKVAMAKAVQIAKGRKRGKLGRETRSPMKKKFSFSRIFKRKKEER